MWLACLVLAACSVPTKFEGAAKFPDGVAGCRRACAAEGLEFGGFVLSGEFATSCVCQPARNAAPGTTAADASSTAGVVVQTQAAAAAAASQQYRMQQQQHTYAH
jgi:hypothetical protein